jgi:hypothetical protein
MKSLNNEFCIQFLDALILIRKPYKTMPYFAAEMTAQQKMSAA